ncbi:MAG: hypothetical protein COW18_12950 [Zetaproteobacteria bacterium CG12_big_fil_rev_8_21_14_0_65_54_13]|nr:MAG: hypothetical protein COW18_12950 [Zetaproteobacteria bacterium CG12_big_fil_rev_8_21_14_0_65_54_13]PIX55624.1 MAG: hypothetical protein COZ50_01830 [Zetaproteobacteria bacterium CG_4_10_14_3_um_filter_54_28]PJA27750.1 MAG: hypothetical protein CO188_11480 [Zetaproteobacteria bacterium CG_4_9_14_3_um_filter_54_145]
MMPPFASGPPQPANIVPVIAVGASAGGLEALKTFFRHMPVNTDAAFVVIVHLDPAREDMMVTLLSRYTAMPVMQTADHLKIRPNHVYIIPPNRDMGIAHGTLSLHPRTSPHGLHLPVNLFFNALAVSQPDRAAAIILSGTGSDGTIGIRAIRQAGGMTMVQNPDDAQFSGMPNSAIATDLVDHILPVAEMGATLLTHARSAWFNDRDRSDSEQSDEGYNTIMAIVQTQLGYNFFPYKQSTLLRRINRRIGLKQLHDMDAYAALLRKQPDETIALFKDMLIGVTSFFRDPDSWALLAAEFFKDLDPARKQPLRIWVPGCSTGEEAYSMAMMLHEYMVTHKLSLEYQIFATDIDSRALAVARQGLYPEQIAANISPQRLEMFFSKEGEYYRVQPWLRQSITFSEQNVTSDPPYSKLDLVSCRNLFIYLQSASQSKVLDMFHFALNPHGYLMLGSSESVGKPSDLFEVISKKWRLYRKKNILRVPKFNLSTRPVRYGSIDMQGRGNRSEKSIMRITDIARTALLHEYVPASLLVNSKYEVLYHFGETSDFLHYPTGETTDDLFALLREGLATRVRGAAHKALKEKSGVSVRGAKVKHNNAFVGVNFRVKCLSDIEGGENLLLISFEHESSDQTAVKTATDLQVEDIPLVKQLESELNSTREELQNTVEELLASNEELKAAHEEAMSANEELQSSNEELETSKEELQSFNEELNTVNSELQEKVISLETANNDISNLIDSTKNASIFLDTDLNIKFFTPSSKRLFNLIASDIGRPLSDIAARFDDPQLADDIQRVMQTEQPSHREVKDLAGNWYNRRILPYRTAEGRILGAVITFDDITVIKHALEEMDHSEQKYRGLFEHMLNGFALHKIVCDEQGKPVDYLFVEVNKAFEQLTGLQGHDIIGRKVTEVLPGIENDSADWITRYGKIALSGKPLRFEQFSQALDKWFSVLAYSPEAGSFATVIEDITDRRQAAALLAESEKHFRDTFEQAAVGIAHVGLDGRWLHINSRLCDMLGYTHDELQARTFQDITHPDDLDSDLKLMQQLLVGSIKTYSMEKRYLRKDGSPLWFNLTASLVLSTDGAPDYFIAVIENINKRKLAEERLRISERTLREAQQTAHIGSWTNDFDGHISWSDELYHIYDVSPEDFTPTTENIIQLVHPDDRPLLQQWFDDCLAEQKPDPIVLRYIRPDGSLRYIKRQGELICDAEGKPSHMTGTAQDITEQKELEEQFQQAQKMEALGTLVGGIAHDFNNILAGITGNIYLAKQQGQMPPDAADRLHTVEGLSFRAANLIQQLLTFARKDKVSMQALPFTPFLKETMKFMRSSIPENITVSQDIPDNPMIIKGDGTQIHQVLMNLINNARDALEGVENPRIDIRLAYLHTDPDFRHAYPHATHDNYAHLSIADNGCGIPEHAIKHLFEPFFTTKEPGKGTGLGLAMAFGAVQTHNGFIDVESTPGKGSVFHIYLPIEEDREITPELAEDGQPEIGHGETILLVDDEPYVIETGKEVLESLGYRVLAARDGKTAVDLFRANCEKIALVMMDVVMPGLSGAKAAEQIRQISPGIKVLFCSGYDKEAALPRDLSSDDTPFLSKPYNVAALSKAIKKQLGS